MRHRDGLWLVCGRRGLRMGLCGDGRRSAVIRAWRIGERIGTDQGVRVGVGQAARQTADAARAAAACDWAVCGRAGAGSGAVRRVGGWCGGLGRWDGQRRGRADRTGSGRDGWARDGIGSAALGERALDRLRVCGVCAAAWWCGACAGGGGTGLVGDLVCCLDASIVRRTLESRAVLCAAGTRPPIRRGVSRRDA